MSKHKDVSMQNALQVSLTDDCCLLVILVSLIQSTSSKKKEGNVRAFAFEKDIQMLNNFKNTKESTWANVCFNFTET